MRTGGAEGRFACRYTCNVLLSFFSTGVDNSGIRLYAYQGVDRYTLHLPILFHDQAVCRQHSEASQYKVFLKPAKSGHTRLLISTDQKVRLKP